MLGKTGMVCSVINHGMLGPAVIDRDGMLGNTLGMVCSEKPRYGMLGKTEHTIRSGQLERAKPSIPEHTIRLKFCLVQHVLNMMRPNRIEET